MPSYQLSVNGKDVIADVDDPTMPLLYFLRNELGLHGPRFGCGLGQPKPTVPFTPPKVRAAIAHTDKG